MQEQVMERPAGRQETLGGRPGARAGMELRVIPIAEIRVAHNPRSSTDVEGIRELARSIARLGQIEPIAVSRVEDGYELVAGGRRLEALKELGRCEATCVVLDEDGPYLRRARSIGENMARRAMSPTDEASALAALMSELGLEVEDVAEAVGVSPRLARERLRLLKLPAPTRAHVRSGALSLRSAALLADLAERSSELAEELGERVASGAVERKAFDVDPAAAVAEIASEGNAAGVFCLPFGEGTRLKAAEAARRVLRAGAEGRLEDGARERVRWARTLPDTQLVEVGSEDVLRARAWGGLVEYRRDRFASDAFLVCSRFAADWLAEALNQRLDVSAQAEGEGAAEPGDQDAAKERARQREERLKAKAANETIGTRVQLHLDYQREVSVAQATVLAALLIEAHGRALVQGLRLARCDWRRREVRDMRGGGTRISERYPEPDEARELFEKLLAKAESGPQLIGRLFSAVASALAVDQRALPPGARRQLELPYAPAHGERDRARPAGAAGGDPRAPAGGSLPRASRGAGGGRGRGAPGPPLGSPARARGTRAGGARGRARGGAGRAALWRRRGAFVEPGLRCRFRLGGRECRRVARDGPGPGRGRGGGVGGGRRGRRG